MAIRPLEELTGARVSLALGNIAEAQSLLDGLLPKVVVSGEMAYEIEAHMLQALAWQKLGEIANALGSLEQAIHAGHARRLSAALSQ